MTTSSPPSGPSPVSFGRLLTVNETAALIGRTPAALRYMISAKTAPTSALVHGRRVFRATDVEAWVEPAFTEESA